MSYSRRIVIDASVLRAAGGKDATFPTSKYCRDTLIAILRICHRATVGDALREEWDKHQSEFSLKWRVQMMKKRKIAEIEVVENSGLRQKTLKIHATSQNKQEALLKDFHLVEAAIATDWIVMSLDSTVRDLFATACEEDDRLSQVMWIGPEDEELTEWLEKGALPDPDKALLAFKRSQE